MGSGKIADGTDEEALGIIPRVVEHIFDVMKERAVSYDYMYNESPFSRSKLLPKQHVPTVSDI